MAKIGYRGRGLQVAALSFSVGLTFACSEIDVSGSDDAAAIDASGIDASGIAPDAGECKLGAICGPQQNIAFVTSSVVQPGQLGGLSGGDEKCNSLADAAGLPGTYIAWLSDSTVNAAERISSTSASGWVRTDGRPFALSRAGLLSENLLYPLSLDENGNDINVVVVTGTSAIGEVESSGTCADWTSDNGIVANGKSDSVSRAWTSLRSDSCADSAHLYCFGVDYDTPLTLPVLEGRMAWLLSQPISASTSLEGMNEACLAEGNDFLGVSSAIAYVGIEEQSIAARLALDGERWVRPDGVLLWENAADLATQPPLAPIGVTAGSDFVDVHVWAGVRSTAALANLVENCDDWTKRKGSGIVGLSISNGPAYLDAFSRDCSAQDVRIYCIEN